MSNALIHTLAVAVVGASVVACGGGGDSSSDGTFGQTSNSGGSNSGGSSNSGNDQSGNNTGGGIAGSGGSGTGTGTGSGGSGGGVSTACATSTLGATAEPLHLVLLLDRSGSMCEYAGDGGPRDCTNKSSKWYQATNAIKTFVASPDSRGIKASMIMFPAESGNICQTSDYDTPIAPEVTLPDSTTLGPAIDKQGNPGGETPTMNALSGAVEYAQSIVTATNGKEKVAIVIATDGYPQGCSDDSNIQPSATVAAGVAGTIPTYVIGVGDLAAQLDKLAAAGGTTKSFTASVSTPSQTGAELSAALATIRGASMTCNFAIPAAPMGQTLDFTKVNVQVTSKGTPTTLGYSQDCSDPNGWKYDNATTPTQIELCTTECSTVEADAFSSVSLVLGCTTQKAGVN